MSDSNQDIRELLQDNVLLLDHGNNLDFHITSQEASNLEGE